MKPIPAALKGSNQFKTRFLSDISRQTGVTNGSGRGS